MGIGFAGLANALVGFCRAIADPRWPEVARESAQDPPILHDSIERCVEHRFLKLEETDIHRKREEAEGEGANNH